MTEDHKMKLVDPHTEDPAGSIPKPAAFSLDNFRSKQDPTVAGVETLQTALPHHNISQAKDFVRLHPNETQYWSPELCFVSVPIKGQQRDQLHPINEVLAMEYLPSAKILRFRLALAATPNGTFFLCHVPTRNTENSWNQSNLQACEQAKTHWTEATSRKAEGVEGYQIKRSKDPDAFLEPNWPKQSLENLIAVTFAGRTITIENDPALLRLIGAKQSIT